MIAPEERSAAESLRSCFDTTAAESIRGTSSSSATATSNQPPFGISPNDLPRSWNGSSGGLDSPSGFVKSNRCLCRIIDPAGGGFATYHLWLVYLLDSQPAFKQWLSWRTSLGNPMAKLRDPLQREYGRSGWPAVWRMVLRQIPLCWRRPSAMAGQGSPVHCRRRYCIRLLTVGRHWFEIPQ
jgi:hypothetical protein